MKAGLLPRLRDSQEHQFKILDRCDLEKVLEGFGTGMFADRRYNDGCGTGKRRTSFGKHY
jgi:hypothetical protein